MKANELRGRQPDELRREMEGIQKELFELKFRWQAEENPDTNTPRRLRKDIARYKTVLREMELQVRQGKG
jgi:large subunit ribosomal protein L29